VTLTTNTKEIQHQVGVRLEILLDARSNSAPAAVQWEFRLPAGLQIAQIEEGEAVKKAGKRLVCTGAKCLVYGMNRTTIPNGPIAIAKIRVIHSLDRVEGSAQFEDSFQSRKGKREVQIVDVVAASPDGIAIDGIAIHDRFHEKSLRESRRPYSANIPSVR